MKTTVQTRSSRRTNWRRRTGEAIAAMALVSAAALIASAADGHAAGQPVRGRFVRVESAASKEYLHFAELEVHVAGKNVAVGKPVRASSAMDSFTPERAVDRVVQYTWGTLRLPTQKGDVLELVESQSPSP